MKIRCALVLSLLPLVACSTGIKGGRRLASLDNNGDRIDDSFDPAIESYFEGSAESEQKKNEEVAEIIRKFIVAQKEVRQSEMKSNDQASPEAKRVFKDLPKPDYATRDVHRKTNGCYKASLGISPDLLKNLNSQLASYNTLDRPQPLHAAVADESELGVFGRGKTYDAVVRLSNGHPGNRPDALPDARGFAVKILPPGTLNASTVAKLSAQSLNEATELDILSINFPTFFVNDPVKYAKVNQAFLDSALDFKNKVFAKAEEFWSIFVSGEFSAMERRLALWVNGSVPYSPLYQEYFSMVPSRLGPPGTVRAIKYSWEPTACSPGDSASFDQDRKKEWADWTNDHTYAFPPHGPSAVKDPQDPYDPSDFPDDFLRRHAAERLRQGDFCFNLYFQLYRDPESTSIEDSTDIWLRSAAEKKWWAEQVVPGEVKWVLDLHNAESRGYYLEKFAKKLESPRVLAGKLVIKRVAPEDSVLSSRNSQTCEDLSFNPWNGDIQHHKPLGVVSRMKRKVYNASRRQRHELNGMNDSKIERP